MNLLVTNPDARWLITAGDKPHAGLMHRPPEVSGVEWASASQPKRWGMIGGYFPGEDLANGDTQRIALHIIADGHAYRRELDEQVVWGQQRNGIFAMKTDHPEGYQAALEGLTLDERADYDRWEQIWEGVLAEAEAADAAPAVVPAPAFMEIAPTQVVTETTSEVEPTTLSWRGICAAVSAARPRRFRMPKIAAAMRSWIF